MALSASNLSQLSAAANFMLLGTAVELPFDQAVIQRLAPVAVSSGFASSTGQFFEACKNKPISTLILFVAFAGGSGSVLPPQ